METAIIIEMPFEAYDGLLELSKAAVPLYIVLLRGVIVRGGSEHAIQISCDVDVAQQLLTLASQTYPAAVPFIEKAIGSARAT